jgi:hypothetical protein
MKLVSPSITKVVPLNKWDPSGETWIEVRQIRAGEQHSFELATWERELEYHQGGDGPVVERSKPSVMKIWLARAAVTFVNSNLAEQKFDKDGQPKVDKDGNFEFKQLFWKGMDHVSFERAWKNLPIDIVEEWDHIVVDMNPHWGTRQFQCPECGYTGQMDVIEIEPGLGK